MALPTTITRPQLWDQQPAIIQTVNREDVLWNRPIFRAPPLKVTTPLADASLFKDLPPPVLALNAR